MTSFLRTSLLIMGALALENQPAWGLDKLQPGGSLAITHPLDVNIVFIGFHPGTGPQQVQESTLRAQLASVYRPIVRLPALYYGTPPQYLGLTYQYNYVTRFAPAAFEDAFFNYLTNISASAPLTSWQQKYNSQTGHALTVANSYNIEAVSVEKWLAANALPMLGVDTRKYTVFFINWYGRPDFRFHLYRKTDEADPDTGINNGAFHDKTGMMAWGGTPPDDPQSGLGSLHRIWFCDLSAGPEWWQDGWNINTVDLSGDGVLDYRMPPVWEYGNLNPAHYRTFNTLSADLGKLVRYAAVDTLFTTSPVYDPMISAPLLPSSIKLNFNLYQGNPDVDAKTMFKPDLVVSKLAALRPTNTFSRSVRDFALTNRPLEIFNCFLGVFVGGGSCFGNRNPGTAFADLYLYYSDHQTQFLEGQADFELQMFGWSTREDMTYMLLGFTDDNWRDGTQSFVFTFMHPPNPDSFFPNSGMTETFTHEAGHYMGLGHPHDGYDYESGIDFGASGDTYFVWASSNCNTVMNYMSSGQDFSQFDRDNMNRWLAIGYLNQANVILGGIAKSPRAGQVAGAVGSADADASAALLAFGNMAYDTAAALSKNAYDKIVNAAAQINVKVEPEAHQADYKSRGVSSKFVDRMPKNGQGKQ